MKKIISAGEIFAIILFALVPVFLSFPYRINIFLSWEGAYRITEGHIPFKDFGMPVGYMYWMIPAMFFKLFGAQLITLIKAQAFINILSGLAFRSIFVSLKYPLRQDLLAFWFLFYLIPFQITGHGITIPL